ncbi:MAG: carboxylate--amine ligase [bacterium]
MANKPYAVVVGLDSVVGLQTARILKWRGVPVLGVTDDPSSFCCRTNVCEKIITTSPGSDGFIETLEELAQNLTEKAVLYPCSDMSVLHLSRNRQRLEDDYHIQLPPSDIVEMLLDKVSFHRYAEENGFPIPKTLFIKSRSDAEQAASELNFPCILKPPKKTSEWLSHAKVGVYKVDNADDLLPLYDICKDWTDILMIQEWIEGSDSNLFTCNCYFDKKSTPLVTFVSRKLRQWPPEAGTGTYGEECRNDAVLHETISLFSSVAYSGLGYLEVKQDKRTGNHYIIEPNIGRPTGRSAIAEEGGVELIYAMYCDAVGLPLPPSLEQRYGDAKWIYWRRDFQAALFYWRRGDLSLNDWWKSWRGKKWSAVFCLKDPFPFFADLARVAGLFMTGGRSNRASQKLSAVSDQRTFFKD